MEKTEIVAFLNKRKFKKVSAINAIIFKREKGDNCSVVRFSKDFMNIILEKWTDCKHMYYECKVSKLTMKVLDSYTSFRGGKKRRIIKKKKAIPKIELINSILLMNGLNPVKT